MCVCLTREPRASAVLEPRAAAVEAVLGALAKSGELVSILFACYRQLLQVLTSALLPASSRPCIQRAARDSAQRGCAGAWRAAVKAPYTVAQGPLRRTEPKKVLYATEVCTTSNTTGQLYKQKTVFHIFNRLRVDLLLLVLKADVGDLHVFVVQLHRSLQHNVLVCSVELELAHCLDHLGGVIVSSTLKLNSQR